jgi:hypothetical protein
MYQKQEKTAGKPSYATTALYFIGNSPELGGLTAIGLGWWKVSD